MKTYDNKQLNAINASDGYFLVLAGPGCGKTDILAERVAKALENSIEPENILCLTFTNRASRGMRSRIEEKSGIAANKIFIGNLHRFCSQFLTTNGLVGENTNIIDEYEAYDIIVEMNPNLFTLQNGSINKERINKIQQLSNYLTQRKLHYPEKLIEGNYDEHFSLASKMRFSSTHLESHLDEINPIIGKQLTYALKYIEYKQKHDLIDFNDLITYTYHYLENDHINQFKRYSWVQVDEIQDLNTIQMSIVDLLTDTSNRFTAMYLGDEQQAIFSFLGAKLNQIDMLRKRCVNDIIHLENNYRSPKYLLDICNTFAQKELNANPELLPTANDNSPCPKHALTYISNNDTQSEENRVNGIINYYSQFDPQERIAILVPTNAAADRLSLKLQKWNIEHFKISGEDMFKTTSFKTISSIISIATNIFNQMGWYRLFYGLGCIGRGAVTRNILNELKEHMLTPMDLITSNTYIEQFNNVFEHDEIVFFDTETTGLNVHEDDIVQIAAFKVRNGKIVENSYFNIFLQTDKSIPETLGDNINPLLETYKHVNPIPAETVLNKFIEYIGDSWLLGHNVTFDYTILQNNIKRYLNKEFKSKTIDSLLLAKLVYPRLHSYKLKDLLSELNIEGTNSHLADDDIAATYNLVKHCYERCKNMTNIHQHYKCHKVEQHLVERLKIIQPIIERITSTQHLPIKETGFDLADTLSYIHTQLIDMKIINNLGSKFDSFIRFVKKEWSTDGDTLYEQMRKHGNDICTSIGEGDLVNSIDLINERVFIMTIHKGKGLEFDNVIILGANDGTYPFYKTQEILSTPSKHTPEEVAQAKAEQLEDARKFYVAISRAKKRLCISHAKINSYNKPVHPTPFMESIEKYFVKQSN